MAKRDLIVRFRVKVDAISFADMIRNNAEAIAALLVENLETLKEDEPAIKREPTNSICGPIIIDVAEVLNDMINNNHPIRRKT